MSQIRLEYREYKVELNASFAPSKQGSINPANEFTEEQWNALPLGKQLKWLNVARKKWISQHIKWV